MDEVVARRVSDGQPIRIRFDSRILAIDEVEAKLPPHRYVCPGFIDIQVNGYGGINFNGLSLSPTDAGTAAGILLKHGTTRAMITLITAGLDELKHRASQAREAASASKVGRELFLGIHLEGPFISPETGPRGAHPLRHCREPSLDEFRAIDDAAGNTIRLVTLAPERPGALAMIEQLSDAGLLVAIGHHQADDNTIDAAIRAGARLCTHLGNGSHAMLPRLANYVQSQLGDDRLMASFIADGHHMPPKTLKNFIRAKGVERSILTTDAIAPAGALDRSYSLPFDGIEVRHDGKVVLLGTEFLAGSSLTMDTAVANTFRWTGCTRAEAVRMATQNPADAIGHPELGRLEVGAVSDLLVVDWDDNLKVRKTWLAGQQLYTDEAAKAEVPA